MNSAFRALRQEIAGMSEGQRIDIEVPNIAFDVQTPLFFEGDALDYMLSTIVGASFRFKRTASFDGRSERIEHMPESDKVWFVDPDRRDMFRQAPDGSFIGVLWPKDEMNNKRPSENDG